MSGVLGVIGGSGVYGLEGLEGVEELHVTTPYGAPSDAIVRGSLPGGGTALFLPRHGRDHRVSPSNINYRANVCAMKQLGATHLISLSAVGSLKDELAPSDVVVVDQFIDLTKRRVSTFFDGDVVAHVSVADPVCPILSGALYAAADECIRLRRAPDAARQPRAHRGGTYVCIEGPQFSSRAESFVYRSWGVDVIGMTNMPEAKLAREAELPYATLAMVTDYDCWHVSEEPVTVEFIIKTLRGNAELARDVVRTLLRNLPDVSTSPARHALRDAVLTPLAAISPERRAELDWLLAAR